MEVVIPKAQKYKSTKKKKKKRREKREINVGFIFSFVEWVGSRKVHIPKSARTGTWVGKVETFYYEKKKPRLLYAYVDFTPRLSI